ncbi:ParM/StbA family protein [Paenibacillus alginolyticus]|uniref:ParM/StbA family protein n=1 Tax=Paenibacillus alginolyticus TaxID=59839 RepID=A0ABT4GA43_9BACL|nr:ParM/StbA family protein [Paenibacillus alginolyticus]MCY9670036.1 ParM/StbA family protein [Paenibacillus alginolyticus]MCY9693061.1 ParM/StbA family protein [Paenibacillus alginolyticus]MEC0147147.1 ParM/StbA family protein [Paenibacillus alginolyticus]
MTKNEVLTTAITLSIDNGSSHVKVIYDHLDNNFIFPNVLAQPFGERFLLMEQGDPLDFLDVQITSPSIESDQYRHVYVGNLAIGDEGIIHEIVGDKAVQKKAQRPETMVTLLTAAAYAIAKKHEDAIKRGKKRIKAAVNLGTGLPIREITKFREEFANKITGGVHSVTFGTTPVFKGITVEMEFSLPTDISIDDVSGVYDLEATSKSHLSHKGFGIADVGGVDMDIAFFKPGLDLDQRHSTGAKIYLNDALESIRNEVNSQGEELIASTAELTLMLVNKEYEIYAEGKVVFDMTSLINRHMRILAEKVLKYARNSWKHVRYANEFWFIGGGAVVLQPWIEKLNAELGLPIKFDTVEHSQFRNVRGTFLMLDHALKHEDETAAASADSEGVSESGSGSD